MLGILVATCATPGSAQINWSSQSPAGLTDDIWCVTYANSTFAAVTSQGNLLTSSDGLTWSSQAISPGTWLTSITYGAPLGGNAIWVVVGDKGTILTSPDLKTWAAAKSNTLARLNGVCCNLDYIAIGENGTVLTSPDAQTWTSQASNFTGFLRGLVSLGVETLVGGQGGELLIVAHDVVSSNPQPALAVQDIESLCLSLDVTTGDYGQIAVGVGEGGTIIYGRIPFEPIDHYLSSTYFDAETFGNYTGRFRAVTWGNGYFVAAGEQGMLATSQDAVEWTQRFAGDSPSSLCTASLLSAAYSDQLRRFVITGTGGTILISNAAPTVFGNVSTRGYVSSTQTFIGGFVIEGTAPRTVLIRADGPVLSAFSVPNPLPDPVLTVYNNAGTVIATNAGWTTNASPSAISSAAQQAGAFALPKASADSALLLTLQPGAYTAQITSAKGNSGIALFEAYTD